jgi:hypothetical protein
MFQASSDTLLSEKKVAPTATGYGRFLFLEQVEKAGAQRPVMARVALAAVGLGDDYPATIGDLLECLNSRNLLATSTFLMLVANAQVAWSPLDLQRLKEWANPLEDVTKA